MVTVPVVLETWLKGQPKFLSQYYDIEIITSNASTIQDIEKYENVSIKIIDFNRKINLFKDLKVLFQLYIYLLKSRPLFVYTLTPKAGLIGMISSWMARVPNRIHNVVGLPHLEAVGTRKKILTLTEKITYFFSTRVYCNSFNLTKIVKNMTNKHVDVIGNGSVNGVDTRYFKDNFSIQEKDIVLNKLNLSNKDFIITFVGRIVKDKGVNELVSVFNNLSKKYNNVKLLLIGDYKNESDPISQMSQEIIENNKSIIYLEFQEDISEYLSISSLFVLPSYREGLPNVLIEAGSYGIPLVATNINGCNEIIEHDKNGILINKKDETDLYQSIEKCIINKKYYAYIKSNIRASIKNKYNQQYFWTMLLKEFKSIEGNQ
jgi:glycosyltransferase involved in cell wall biosynthesis